jgi:exodeoxyribonuclease V alpha subunit
LIVTHDIEEPDIVEHGLAETVVAPFVQQHGLIYLYRYWQLERRLAIQVARLKQQKIQHVDVVAFDRSHLIHIKSCFNYGGRQCF